MTLRELIINTLQEESEELLDKELAYFVKDNPDGTFDAITINALGITDSYLLLSNKCPNCKD